MRLRFFVQGSAAEPYSVIIERAGDNLRASCVCPAGMMGQYCKHRVRLFGGSDEGVIGGDVGKIKDIPAMVKGTDVEVALAKLAAAEEDAERAKRNVSAAKKALARAMDS